jgi:hypothetical protein
MTMPRNACREMMLNSDGLRSRRAGAESANLSAIRLARSSFPGRCCGLQLRFYRPYRLPAYKLCRGRDGGNREGSSDLPFWADFSRLDPRIRPKRSHSGETSNKDQWSKVDHVDEALGVTVDTY